MPERGPHTAHRKRIARGGSPAIIRRWMITPFQEGSVGDVVFNLSVDAIVVMNARGQIVGWNPAAEALFGWPLEEAMSKRVVDLIVPEQFRAAHEAGLKRYRETGEGPVLGKTLDILTALRRDGSEFPLGRSASRMRAARAPHPRSWPSCATSRSASGPSAISRRGMR